MIHVMWQYYMARGFGDYLFVFFFFVGFYFLWSIGGKLLAHWFLEGDARVVRNAKEQCTAIAIGMLALLFLLVLCIVFSFVVIRPGISEQLISRNNNLLMGIDRRMFGVYVPLWFQQSSNALKPVIDAAVPFFIAVYYSLTSVLTVTLFLLFFLRTRLCIECIFAFFLCAIISVPFWYFFPSISPLIAYWQPILSQDIPPSIDAALRAYSPLPQLARVMQDSVDFRSSVRETALVVTTIPSMHIAWSFLVAYYLTALSRRFAIVAIPYFLLNSISTMVTMQHYAIDTVGGVAVALFAIFVTAVLSQRIMPVFDPIVLLVRDDRACAWQWVREVFTRRE